MPPDLVDTHAHLIDDCFRDNMSATLSGAARAGVMQILVIGTTATDSRAAVALASSHRGLFAAVGIQPNLVAGAAPRDFEVIAALAKRPRVVAVGETGLDRYWDNTPFVQQQTIFDRHLDLAAELGLPVVIHCRDCERDVVAQLAPRPWPVSGVLHSFTGGPDEAEAFLELGLHISFAGMVTFTNKKLQALRSAAALVPPDRLLIETDSPYLAPHPLRGQANEPANLVHTARRVAELRGIGPIELAALTTLNARRLFGLTDIDRLAPEPVGP